MNAVSRAPSIAGGHPPLGDPVAKSLEMHRVEAELDENCYLFGGRSCFFIK